MFQNFKIKMAARRIGVRDKGQVKEVWQKFQKKAEDGFGMPSFGEMMAEVQGGAWTTEICVQCHEPIRIGTMKDGTGAVKWCWKCEWKRLIDLPSQQATGDDDASFLEDNGLRF